jgi:hypothetical protein
MTLMDDLDAPPLIAQMQGHQMRNILVVLDYQDGARHTFTFPFSRRPKPHNHT